MSTLRSRRRELLARIALVAGSLVFFVCVLEVGLRFSGFSYRLVPEDIEFGQPDPMMLRIGFDEDDDVFWLPRGFRDRLAGLAEDPPRLVLLGDSVTHLGRYDSELVGLVEARRGARLDVANLGVVGWSSYQGRQLLRRDVVPLRPEVVTIFFGWNDHWTGFGVDDATVGRIRRVLASRWSRLRTVQLLTKATVVYFARRQRLPERVSREDFAANLREMAGEARAAGIDPMFLTAPSFHRPGQEPAGLAERWLRDVSDLIPIHQAYVEIVRAVAEEQRVPLCDLAAELAHLAEEEQAAAFMDDGIHLRPPGDRVVAELLYTCLARMGWLDRLADS